MLNPTEEAEALYTVSTPVKIVALDFTPQTCDSLGTCSAEFRDLVHKLKVQFPL